MDGASAVVDPLQREALVADTSLVGRAFCAAYTNRMDAWLAQLFEAASGPRSGAAIVALGGYGRRELCPQSDLDVVLLHEPRVDVASLAERLWYPIWDEGLKLGHATLTPAQALQLAAGELDMATSLLEARHVAGDRALSAELADSARRHWVKRAAKWLPSLRASLVTRAVVPGEVAFVLEPDLKLGRGGLRDVHLLGWLEVAQPGLVEADRDVAAEARDCLLDARVALHRRTGRRGDVLLLQEQDGVAEDLGFADADELMGSVAGAARSLEWLTDDALDRFAVPTSRWRRRPRTISLGGGVTIRDHQVHADGVVPPEGAGALQLLDVARVAAGRDLRIARDTLERFAAAEVVFPNPWPLELRERFVELLRAGPAMIPVAEALDHWGLWVRVLPEWEPCRSRPQRNAYHRFTVDRHLLEAAANAAELANRVERADLLLLAALLHDIGKGYPPRDHSEVGVELVGVIAPRMGYGPGDTAVLAELIRHHLLLPDVATRRDLSDDATISHVADVVRSESRLELLHTLTEADATATGPAAWGDWKAGLVATLVERTRLQLKGHALGEVENAFPSPHQEALMAAGEKAVEWDDRTLTVVDWDRPGLFARVAGVLALNGLDVLAANAVSDNDGMALEEFTVTPQLGGDIDWPAVQRDIERALTGRLAVRARLSDRAKVYGQRYTSAPSPAPFEKKVVFDNDASPRATVVEVRAPDAVGLLYRVSSALTELDLDIRSARIQTLADHVVDAFYVLGPDGDKLTEPDHLREVERALLHALAESAPSA